jgi:hypothetical protein
VKLFYDKPQDTPSPQITSEFVEKDEGLDRLEE